MAAPQADAIDSAFVLPKLPDVQEMGSVPETLEPIALSLPPELPHASDLDLRTPTPTSAENELAFELDLSKFDATLAAPAPAAGDALGVDAGAAALFAPFDLGSPTAPVGSDRIASQTDAAFDLIDLDLGAASAATPGPVVDSAPPPDQAAEAVATASAPAAPFGEEEQVKIVGPLRIGIPLFNIFLNEADELSRRLTTEVAEWAMELHRPVGETAIALAHSLAGSSATVGFSDLSHLSRLLEHALTRTEAIGHGTQDEGKLFVETAEEIRRLLHQFAAGFLKEPPQDLLQRLADHEVSSALRLDAVTAQTDAGEAALLEEQDDADGAVDLPLDMAPTAAGAPTAAPAPTGATQPGELPHVLPGGFVDSGFGAPDSRFDALGVAEFKPLTSLPADAVRVEPGLEARDIDDDIDAVDAVDADLFPIFEEEAQELLPKLESQLRDWASEPSDTAHASACMRTLHTLKGGARLAGAMRLGEMAHRLESAIEELLRQESATVADVEELHNRSDALSHTFEALRSRDAAAYAQAVASTEQAASQLGELDMAAVIHPLLPEPAAQAEPLPLEPAAEPAAEHRTPETEPAAPAAEPTPAAPALAVEPIEAVEAQDERAPTALTPLGLPEIDWSRFSGQAAAPKQPAAERGTASQSAVRVRAPLLDRLVNQAGEVSITRSRIEVEVNQIKGSLTDLTDNLERLRGQLRDIELQAETQMSSRLEAAKAAAQSFDPLEFDRFTRFQELTRMMAESVNDVATVQRTLQRTL
ncbi:MAG TPA: Hpt domain-containing protein, partial [Albitalea sp.]